jgi:hypothetical protein
MAETETQDDKPAKGASPNPVQPEFAASGNNRLDELFAAQTRQLEKLREVSKNWSDRARWEAALASELSIKLMAARSAPEVANAYQEWAIPHMERAAEDAKRILTDAQKLAEQFFRHNGHSGS